MNLRTLTLTGLALTVALCAATAAKADNEKGKGVLKGTVKWNGERPRPSGIDMKKDGYCDKCYKANKVPAPATWVTKELEIPDVFIYVKSGISGKYDVPTEPITINQENCMYEPHVQGMIAGQAMKIVNSDDTAHNIHAMPNKNNSFNFGQPNKGMTTVRDGKDTFTKPELMVSVKCDVHPWMSCYVGVMEHPFFGVSDKKGAWEIKDLPDGEYEIEAWHEKWGKTSTKVTVKDGATEEVKLEFGDGKAAADQPAEAKVVLASTVTGEEAPSCCKSGKAEGNCADSKQGECCKAKAAALADATESKD